MSNAIGWAVKEMLDGNAVTRTGWNGAGQFLYYVKPGAYKATSPVAKKVWGEEGLVSYSAYIALKNTQNDVVPWQASQGDLLATDWELYNV